MSPITDLPPEQLLFNQGEVAHHAGISRHLVKVSIQRGDLPTRRVGGMNYVTRAALLRFIEQLYGDDDPGDGRAVSVEEFHQSMRRAGAGRGQ
jgi:hypothetical protein